MSDNYTLGKYQIIRELGRGAFGIVYEAKDIVLARSVAIKVLHPNLVNDSEFIARFHQEARLAAQLDHPNIVPIHDFDQKNGRYFIVMGLMRNGSIKDLLEKYGPRNSAQTKSIVEQAASGLAFAHERDIIHRDLKPGNILVDEHGFARVSDFGFAKAMSEVSKTSLSMTGGILGTPAYIPPEIWEGKAATPRSDIYSLGCITYELLTGKTLFDGESAPQIMMQHMVYGPQLPDSINEAWRNFISRCLARDPKDRYQSTGALLEDLQWGLFDVAPSHTSEIVLETLEEEDTSQPEVLHQQDTEAQVLPSSTDTSRSEYQQTPISIVEFNAHDSLNIQRDQSAVSEQHDHEHTFYEEPLTVGQELEYKQQKSTKKRKWLLASIAVIAVILFVVVGILLSRGFQKSSNLATNEPPPVELPAPHEPLEDVSKPVPIEPVEPEPEPTRESIWASVEPAKDIVFWHNYSGNREVILQRIVDDFNATNEYGITLHAEFAGRLAEIYTKMKSILNSPDVPDIVISYQNQVAEYQLYDAIFDINTIIDDPIYGLTAEDKDDYVESFLAQDVYSLFDNQRLGIAPYRSMEVMYTNLDWLKEMGYNEAPKTPEEFKEMVCEAGEQPFSIGTGDAKSTGMYIRIDATNMASWVFAFGGDIYNTIENKFTFNSPEAIEAMSFLQSLAADDCVRNFDISIDGLYDEVQFGAGKSLFTIASSSGLGVYYPTAITEGVGEMEWSVASLPNTGKIKQNIYGASLSIPKSTPARELAGWIFLKYFTSPDVQVYWAENTQYLPVRKSAATKMANFFKTHPQFKATWELVEYSAFEPAVPDYDSIREEMNNALIEIISDTTISVDSVMSELNETANEILNKQFDQIILVADGNTRVRDIDNMEMVYVPHGIFTMGSQGDDDSFGDEKPQRKVYLDSYWIDKYEVSNMQYRKCVDFGPCTMPSQTNSYTRSEYYNNPEYNNYPVIYVDWHQASQYCEWVGGSLPTEAQWEKAARGTDGRKYPWGNENQTCLRANYDNCRGDTVSVFDYSDVDNPYGALNMAGNVWEWVKDRWGAYDVNHVNNPVGPSFGTDYVLRGGSWYGVRLFLRVTNRGYRDQFSTESDAGFRCVLP